MRPEPKFNIGDRVKIIDHGMLYSTYPSFFAENDINPEMARRYAYGVGSLIIQDNCVGKVVASGYYKGVPTAGNLHVIQLEMSSAIECDMLSDAVYIINEDGLESMPLRLTKAEAESKYNIEIID